MAVIQEVKHEGKVDLPKVLIVHTPGIVLDSMIMMADQIRNAGMEPVYVAYDKKVKSRDDIRAAIHANETARETSKAIRMDSLDAIAQFAANPDNDIAMVLSGNKSGDDLYGEELATLLKKGTLNFKGPVAIQVGGRADPSHAKITDKTGAIGVYDGGLGVSNPKSPFTALMKAYQAGLGEGR